MHIHQTAFTFGDTVYLKTDQEQLPRMVLSFWIRPDGVMYELGHGPDSSDHYEFEISRTVDESIKLGLTKPETA